MASAWPVLTGLQSAVWRRMRVSATKVHRRCRASASAGTDDAAVYGDGDAFAIGRVRRDVELDSRGPYRFRRVLPAGTSDSDESEQL